MTEKKKIQIEFAPGCFDNFEGTQEELDDLIAEIKRLVETGELQERARPVDLDSMSEEEAIALAKAMGIDPDNPDADPKPRTLN